MPTAEQVVPCRVPLRSFEWAGLTRPVHEGIIGDLEWIRHQWLLRGGQGWYPIHSWWGYAPRDCRTGAHPRGVALDVNPPQNPMVSKRTPCPSNMPGDFINLFKARGFGWGGDWRSKCDAMHMSKLKYEGGNGVLYTPANISTTPAPPPTPPSSHGDRLQQNQPLFRGQQIVSADGRFRLILQGTDGNLVLYKGNTPLWATHRFGDRFLLQGDGNLVLYRGNTPMWASRTRAGDTLVMQSDGNLVLYATGRPSWATHTAGR